MRYLTAILSIAVFTMTTGIASAGDLGDKVSAQGRYYGVGWQKNASHWSIELLLNEFGGQIAYPSLDCNGDWTLIEATPDKLQYFEKIVEGTENCVELGTAFLEPLPDGRLLYTWREHAATVDARAILVPVKGARLPYIDLLLLTLNGVEMDYLFPEYLE
jgi:hypothetical protein